MAGYTDYLNLYFKNPRTDGADTFNVQTMMNDNWDKIDAFASMAGLPTAGTGFVFVRCLDQSGAPVSGCAVQVGASVAVSSPSGFAKLQLAPGSYTAIVRAPIDFGLGEKTVSVTAVSGGTATVTVTIEDASTGENEISITESVVAAFSGRVTSADVFGVAGGGSGGAAVAISTAKLVLAAATGGGSGNTATVNNVSDHGLFDIQIGLGGAAVKATITSTRDTAHTDGENGGDTIVQMNGVEILSARGGYGGTSYGSESTTSVTLNGANGGSGSGAVAGSVGDSGVDGQSGGDSGSAIGGIGQGYTTAPFREYDANNNLSQAGGSAIVKSSGGTTGGTGSGAGKANAALGEDVATSVVCTPAVSNGSGGGGAVVSINRATDNREATATSGAGADGLVIFRWEVAS